MIRDPFTFFTPAKPEEAAAILTSYGADAAVLGGGTMLIPSMSLHQRAPAAVISLAKLGLSDIRKESDHIVIGASTSYADLLRSSIIAEQVSLLRHMADQVTGGPAIRNQGTVGGSACYANPASDVPACLVVLEAKFELRSVNGIRSLDAAEFFVGAFQTGMRSDEFLTCIRVPISAKTARSSYRKFKFCASSWPIVTVACITAAGATPHIKVSVGGAGGRPTFQTRRLIDRGDGALDAAIEWLAVESHREVGDGWSDELADGSYRRALVPPLVKRSLRELLEVDQ